MTIIKITSTSNTRYHQLQSQNHRDVCWLDGYLEVPLALEQKVYACLAHCDLVIENGELVNVLPIALPQPTPTPTPEQDRDEMMVDQEFRLTMLELEFVV